MRTSKMAIGVFASVLFTFAFAAHHTVTSSIKVARVAATPQSSSVLIADGGDPLPKPWGKFTA